MVPPGPIRRGTGDSGHATFILFLSSNSLDWSLTIPSSDSIASIVVVTVVMAAACGASRPFCANCSRASTGSSSVGGRGKGGVRVGEGQDHEVPGEGNCSDGVARRI